MEQFGGRGGVRLWCGDCFLEVLPRALLGEFMVFEVFSLGEFLALLPSALPSFWRVPSRSGVQPPLYFCEGGGGGEEVDRRMHVCVGGGLFFLLRWGLRPQGFDVAQVVRGLLGWVGRFEELSAVQWDWLCAGVSC